MEPSNQKSERGGKKECGQSRNIETFRNDNLVRNKHVSTYVKKEIDHKQTKNIW